MEDTIAPYNFEANISPSKTAALVKLRSPKASALWQSLKLNRHQLESTQPATARGGHDQQPPTVTAYSPLRSGHRLPLVDKYQYLGKWTTADGKPSVEVKARLHACRAAFSAHKLVLLSPALKTKASVAQGLSDHTPHS
eukprot:4590508-Amphidinium_carterae.1